MTDEEVDYTPYKLGAGAVALVAPSGTSDIALLAGVGAAGWLANRYYAPRAEKKGGK